MTNTVRIGQLSDIHVRDFSGLTFADIFRKRLIGYVNYEARRRSEYSVEVVKAAVSEMIDAALDHVVVTGDLSNVALESAWRRARTLLEPLDEAGIGLSVIPGNHDAYVSAALDGTFERVFDDWRGDAHKRAHPYPYVVRVGPVSLVHANTGVPTPPLQAFGRLGEAQLGRLNEVLSAERAEGRVVVLALHHHPTRAPHKEHERTRGLHDAAALREVLRAHAVPLVLHGHNHYFHARRLRDAPETLIVGCSCSTTTQAGPAPRRGQWLRADVGEGGVEQIAVRWWDSARGAFGDDEALALDDVPVETEREALDGPLD